MTKMTREDFVKRFGEIMEAHRNVFSNDFLTIPLLTEIHKLYDDMTEKEQSK